MKRCVGALALLVGCSSPYSPINMTELPETSAHARGSAAPSGSALGRGAPSAPAPSSS
ncbi:MAG: hypothetical protein U0414_41875 [Polyangiaceae bacterium]